MTASRITLENTSQRLVLLPELGASVANWDLRRDKAWHPLWRPYQPSESRRIIASFALLPWSNRLPGGGFALDGSFHAMASNRADSAVPVHGTGWMQAWRVAEHSATHAVLEAEAFHPVGYPWHYRARQHFALDGDTMTMRVDITHLGALRLPYGLGFHPYIVRAPGMRMRFGASGYWRAEDCIPVGEPLPLPPEWDFNTLREVGDGLIDHNFCGCDGRMTLERPDLDLRLDWQTTEPAGLDTAIVYRPQHGEWFCYEPVTHITGAHARPGLPGLRLLETGETLSLAVRQTLSPLHA
ncbi:MAG: aldose 1-epimerase [Candidatus Dactylopiibacterium sp.]|nr:aldose 1-epimerase [Candidatus Dactylopiibacterium sp.]